MTGIRWLSCCGIALLVFLATGCRTAAQPAGFEVRFLPDAGVAAPEGSGIFDIRPRDELLVAGNVALPMDFDLNVRPRDLSKLRVQIACDGALYSFAPKTRHGTCVIPIRAEGDVAVVVKLFSEINLVGEKHFLVPRFPNPLAW